MDDHEQREARRRANWCQTPATRIPDPDAAAALIDRVGLATLFAASPEVPNLFHAYMGDPQATTDSKWDSPAGEVYSWRWALGRREAAFYTALVRGKPTWVSWKLLPAVLRLKGAAGDAEGLYRAGQLSENAHRIAQALNAADGVLETGALRKAAGFPTGTQQRAAYLKAVEELEGYMLLAKLFSPDDDDMRHGLVRRCYPAHAAQADALTPEAAMDQLLASYLLAAVYAEPKVLARHLRLDAAALRAGLDRLVAAGRAGVDEGLFVSDER
ncbi:MAG: hypothetical protein H7Y32_00620 [Chloroflexales bacterium]|nr:hypothetical protein [Chloroflexales bacterium]